MKTLYGSLAAGLMCVAASSTPAASIYVEHWDADEQGWVDRDAGEMAVIFTSSGSPGGALGGTFAAQDVPGPETDAFRATAASSGGSFAGDYWSGLGTFYGWRFSFYAEDLLPSDIQVRFNGNGSTFFASLMPQVTGVGSWLTLQTPTTFAGNWLGGSGTQWTNALAAVQFVEIQITRNGTTEQSYRLDNFANGPFGGDPGPSAAVPEPAGPVLLLLGAGILWSRMRVAARRRRLLGEMPAVGRPLVRATSRLKGWGARADRSGGDYAVGASPLR